MLGVAEEVAVGKRHLQQPQLQSFEWGVQRRRQRRVTPDCVEHVSDEVEDDAVLGRRNPGGEHGAKVRHDIRRNARRQERLALAGGRGIGDRDAQVELREAPENPDQRIAGALAVDDPGDVDRRCLQIADRTGGGLRHLGCRLLDEDGDCRTHVGDQACIRRRGVCRARQFMARGSRHRGRCGRLRRQRQRRTALLGRELELARPDRPRK